MAEEVLVSPSDPVGHLIHWMNDLETKARAIISDIPHLEDEQLQLIHDQATTLGHWSWKIQAAARKEILYRAAKAKRGRGNVDLNEEGRKAVAKKLAAQLGCHPSTIMEDAAIAATFFPENSRGATTNLEEQGSYEHLTEKEYYRAALRTEDPHGTLEHFAKEKIDNPSFSTSDAWNYVKSLKTPSLDSAVPPLIEDGPAQDWYHRFVEVLEAAPAFPGLRRILVGCVEEVRDYMQRPTTTRRNQLYELIEQGVDELDQIAQELGVDRVHVGIWLHRMAESDQLEAFEKDAQSRGPKRTGYRIINKE